MFSSHLIFGLGLIVSVVNVFIWVIILRSQIKQFNKNAMNHRIKVSLMIFGIVALLSNFTPIWFDIYQIARNAHPTNIGVAYTISQYLFRTITAFMFYVIYKA